MFLKNKNIIFKIRRSKVTDYAALNEMYVWFLLPTYPNCFNPTLNLKMVFGEKIPKIGTFPILSLFFLLNVITKFNNFPTYLP